MKNFHTEFSTSSQNRVELWILFHCGRFDQSTSLFSLGCGTFQRREAPDAVIRRLQALNLIIWDRPAHQGEPFTHTGY